MSVTDSTSTDHQYIVESTYTAVLVYVLAQYKLTYFTFNSHDLPLKQHTAPPVAA